MQLLMRKKQSKSNNTTPKQKFSDIQFDHTNYDHSMLKALNHYNLEVESNQKQEWVLDYFNNNNLETNRLGKLPSSLFDQLGVLVRLKELGVKLLEVHERYILSKHHQLLILANNSFSNEKHSEHYKKIIKEKIEPVGANDEVLENLLINIEDHFDIILLEKKKLPDISKLLSDAKLNKNQYQLIKIECKLKLDKYKSLLAQYDIDDEIKESYQNIKKAGLQRGIDFLELIIKTCDNVVVKKKITRQKKNKPAKDVVKKLKYLIKDNELNIESFDPKYIIGCKELILFNSKIRKIFIYKSIDDTGLSINGSTLLNFSEENSFCKTIRKPEIFFKDFEKLAKRETNNKIKDIKSVSGKTTGRINKDCLLLKYY